MPEPTPEAWAQIRHAYENTDQPLAHICAEHDVTVPTVRYRMRCWGWTRRKPLIPRHGPPPVPTMPQEIVTLPAAQPPSAGEDNVAIVPRLQGAAARVVTAIDAIIARLASGTLNANDIEKSGRTLGTLTRTLRELNALLLQHNAPLEAEDDPVPKNIDEFRFELARRIRGFIEARKHEDDALAGQNGPPHAAVDGPART